MVKSLKTFWLACEKFASAGVMRDWENAIGDSDVLAAAKRLLAPTDQQSLCYPCINEDRCGCSHEVITHKDGTIVAICTCEDGECDTIPLIKEDITIFEMNHSKILGGVARAAGLMLVEPLQADIHKPMHFADLDVGGTLIPAYFAMTGCGCLDKESLINLLVGSYEAFIMFTLSPFDFHINSPNPWYRDSRLAICLADMFTTDEDKIRVDHRLKKLVENFARRVQGYNKAQNVCAAYSDTVFAPSNDYHTIVLRGKQLPHLTDLQADVVRVLHTSLKNGSPEMSYHTISCAVADAHTDDIGFEPPSKMSQVFRSGDERGELILSTKPGYYKLNI